MRSLRVLAPKGLRLCRLRREPVLHVESGDPPEVVLVIGHDCKAVAQGRSGDEDVRVSDRLSTRLQRCVDIRRTNDDLIRQRENQAGLAEAIEGLKLRRRILGLEARRIS